MATRIRQLRVADGTRVAYQLSGKSDGPVLVLLDGISCAGFIFQSLRPHLERRARVLHLHYRGHGRSGLPRDPSACTLPDFARDLIEIMDAEGLDQATLIGHSMGVQVALEAAWRYPARVRGLVLACGAHGRVLDTFKHTDLGAQLLPLIHRFTRRHQSVVARTVRAVLPTGLTYLLAVASEVKGERVRRDDFMPYLEHFARMPLDLFLTTLHDAAHRTSAPFLARVEAPTLVIIGAEDSFTPAEVSLDLAARLPSARFELIAGASHVGPREFPRAFERAIDEFLEEARLLEPASSPRPQPRSWAAALADRRPVTG